MAAGKKRKRRKNTGALDAIIVLSGILTCVVIIGFLISIGQFSPPTEPVPDATSSQTDPTPTEPSAESTSAPTVAPTETEPEPEPTEVPTEATAVPTDPPAILPTVKPTVAPMDDPEVPMEILLTLVNSTHFVPEDWTVDLVVLNTGEAVDRRAYPSLQRMMDDCRAAGLDPVICSGYRTNNVQTQLYENRVKRWMRDNPGCTEEEAREGAAFWVARPGTSEHQLGFAVDIVSNSNWNLDSSQEKTATQQWLMQNSWRYGWILRYPTDKSEITKVGYEPWHYRYVGVEAARDIYESGLCLEEYLNMLD